VRRGAAVHAASLLLPAAILGPFLGPLARAGAEATSFDALAAADGIRTSLIAPHAAVTDTIVDLGGPSTQAKLDSIGESRAFASFPYPGEFDVTVPGLVRGLEGVPVPDYPLYVSSSDPTVPKQEMGSGPYAINAESSRGASSATATVGAESPGEAALGLSRSDAAVNAGPDAVVSQATTDTSAFVLGPLRIGRVLSSARARLGAAGTVTRTADTQVLDVSVAGTPVALTPNGLSAAGSSTPSPDLGPATTALRQAGITIELMGRQELPSGVVAPTVRITQQQPGATLVYVLGLAEASLGGSVPGSAAGGHGGAATANRTLIGVPAGGAPAFQLGRGAEPATSGGTRRLQASVG